jgi:hypothetical protein
MLLSLKMFKGVKKRGGGNYGNTYLLLFFGSGVFARCAT